MVTTLDYMLWLLLATVIILVLILVEINRVSAELYKVNKFLNGNRDKKQKEMIEHIEILERKVKLLGECVVNLENEKKGA